MLRLKKRHPPAAGNSKERLNLGEREELELTKRRVLVVDDSISTLKVLMAILADEGYEVLGASSGPKALRILQGAYKARPDAEIAAHLGEVLWSMGQREQAMSIWREGVQLNTDNETLAATLKRLRVKL